MTSRVEKARDNIIAEFELITLDNDFRNDVSDVVSAIRPLTSITSFPEIGVQVGTRNIDPIDGAWTVADGLCDVYVQGAVESDANMEKSSEALATAIESLTHDMCRVMSVIYTKYINNVLGKWNIAKGGYKITPFFDFGTKKNKGIVLLEFKIQLRSMNETHT